MARVEWTDTGEESFLEIGRFIAKQNQSRDAALRVMEKVEGRCRLMADFPNAGTARDDFSPNVRSFPIDGLLVVYRPLDDGIRILLVAHTHQDLPAVFGKLFPDA